MFGSYKIVRESMEVAEDSHRPFPLMESHSKSRTGRHSLLYAWGVSLLAIAHKAYIMVEELHGPFGSLAQRLASLASPIVHTMQYQWLEILSFVDDQILAIEDMLKSLFPPSAYVFDRIDMITDICWILAGKLDHIMDDYQMVTIDQVTFLNWVATHLNIGLNFLISTMMEWDDGRMEEERDIFMDINCDEHSSETPREDPKGAKQVLTHNSMEKTPIFDKPQHPEPKVETTEKPCNDDNIEKPSIIDDIKHNENKAVMMKKPGINDYDYMEKPPNFNYTKYDVAKKVTIFDDTKHAKTNVGMPNKAHIFNGIARGHVDRARREILGALEKIATKESSIRSQAIRTVPIHKAPLQVQTQQAAMVPIHEAPLQVQTQQAAMVPIHEAPLQVQTQQAAMVPIHEAPLQVQTQQAATVPIHEAPPQVQTQQAAINDDMILELFDAGWHSQRGSKRGA
ncbi:uncharacterized protein LOC131246317 [Magnolia sinica]|uniref:uncharacterized protein LOC131246317 n=1 Tax=Magnolia sinica TaxID=86752 RepID=UPI0026593F2E|nr:uncharacterized protein LOC131246317 [Magnolia sinica]